MLAYVYSRQNNLALLEREAPEPTDESVVIKVEATSICGTDLRTYRFGSSKIKPPRVIGHEVVGEIVSVGSNVHTLSVGDRVQVAPAIGCGTCIDCREGHTNLCDSLETIGFDYDGTFAEFMEIPQKALRMGNVNKISQEVPYEQAVLSEPIACIINAHQYLNISAGDVVAIFGSGFIGCMHAELATLEGAAKVIMIEVNPARAAAARKINENLIVINPKSLSLSDEIKKLTDGRGVNVSIVACSVGSAQTDAMNITAKRGRISLFGGLPTDSIGFIDSNIIHYREISVFGVHASSPTQNREALRLISSGILDVKPYSSNIFSLRDIDKAFMSLNNETIMKAIIVP